MQEALEFKAIFSSHELEASLGYRNAQEVSVISGLTAGNEMILF